jgi:hypothetical protein
MLYFKLINPDLLHLLVPPAASTPHSCTIIIIITLGLDSAYESKRAIICPVEFALSHTMCSIHVPANDVMSFFIAE